MAPVATGAPVLSTGVPRELNSIQAVFAAALPPPGVLAVPGRQPGACAIVTCPGGGPVVRPPSPKGSPWGKLGTGLPATVHGLAGSPSGCQQPVSPVPAF